MSSDTYNETISARDSLFSSLGAVDPDVIAPIINPGFMGGPRWPSFRQAFSIIRSGDNTTVVSNGLSDPFDDEDEPNNGFKLEIMAETNEELSQDIASSWLFKLVSSISQQAAHSGQIAEFVANHGVITTELYGDECGLEAYKNENGMVGVMLGVEHPDLPKEVSFPAENILLVTAQLLTPDELNYVVENRAEGRNHLHELLKKSGIIHLISLNRRSLLVAPPETKSKNWWQFWK